MLPLAVNSATRITQALLPAGKEYVALMYVHDDIPEEKVRAVFASFTGKISQLPPVKSAVKRELRERQIYYIEVLEVVDREVLFRMGCQGGTYVRKYIHDIGKALGCGAHMKELVRTKAGPFSHREWVSLHEIKDAFVFYEESQEEDGLRRVLLPIEKAVAHLPKVIVADSAIHTLCRGSPLYAGGIAKVERCVAKGSVVAVMSLKGELVCLGTAMLDAEGMVAAARGIAVRTEKVFMSVEMYPKHA